jgi:hypothetical protein
MVPALVLTDRPFVTGWIERRGPAAGGAVVHGTFGGCRSSRRRRGVGSSATRIDDMSDHTERLRKLRDRIVAAKEFL